MSKLHTYAVTLVRTETKTSVITINIDAESPEDARVLAKYETVRAYQWFDAETSSEDTVTINGAVLLAETAEVPA